jgi:hypothetical protein
MPSPAPAPICTWCYRRLKRLRYLHTQYVRLWSAPQTVALTYAYCSPQHQRWHVDTLPLGITTP